MTIFAFEKIHSGGRGKNRAERSKGDVVIQFISVREGGGLNKAASPCGRGLREAGVREGVFICSS